MKEKNFEYYEFVGFLLISTVLLFFLYPINSSKNKIQNTKDKKNNFFENTILENKKSVKNIFNKGIHGDTILENNVLRIKFSNQGGHINEIFLKKYKAYNYRDIDGNDKGVFLVKNKSFLFKLIFQTLNGEIINTSNLFFTPKLEKKNGVLKLIMRANLFEGKYIDYIYVINNKENYDIKFSIRSKGFINLVHKNKIFLKWNQQIFRLEKDKNWEKNYTQIYYSYDQYSKINYLSESEDDQKNLKNVNWIANKQQFFTSIFSSIVPFNNIEIKSLNLTSRIKLKNFEMQSILDTKNNELNFLGQWYFGPIDYKILKKYNQNFEYIIPFGWGILRWINIYFFLLIFSILSKTQLSYGIIIILMTIVVKIILSPITYKQYKISAMMKVIRPEIENINEKYKKASTLKKQQVMMELYRKTGVNPMSGCLPSLLQIPIFYALFKFFPTIIDLRGQSFLWADDLTSYDSILDLSFSIPIYGDHISLFSILYVIALLLYTKINSDATSSIATNQNNNIYNMKFMMYLMPFIMLLFINTYASGLSLYYFTSNILNIVLIFIIKKFIINEKKIHKKIQENKKNPKKLIGWQERIKKLVQEVKNTNNI